MDGVLEVNEFERKSMFFFGGKKDLKVKEKVWKEVGGRVICFCFS